MHHVRYLRYVDAVARTGSIRKAAERLNIVSSAVNRRILDLEQEIGTPLFERLPRGVRLTPAGEIFVAYLRRALAEVDRVQSEIEDLQGLRRGVVRIAAIEGLATHFLPDIISNFQRDHPKIVFGIDICGRNEVVKRVKLFEADLGLVFNPPPDADLRHLAEIEERLCAFVPTDHPLADRRSVRLSECVEFPLAIPDRSLGGRVLLDNFLSKRSLKLEPNLETNSYELMRHFVLQSGGVYFQISTGVPQPNGRPGLVAIPLEERGLAVGKLVLCCERSRTLPVAAAMVAEQIQTVLDGIAAESR
ncbi:LysR family transcriptional regulator [Hydrocarboniclastica marina]|uniref:LysR family transcriptional regulator n=1 Tax=Hydrocarboniclastica marina TaxID=2259620 RepID=A0A4P7XMP8_9ALTE|nr:LysR family transcriptional regulator [Hydrocarboniclastica marina]MAM00116.1 LysR family transcriptional regulator [Alteromonadaceae bacterium]QCF27427.1 LysR family transcriptional regulator [Hydrocarboniclastica marina]